MQTFLNDIASADWERQNVFTFIEDAWSYFKSTFRAELVCPPRPSGQPKSITFTFRAFSRRFYPKRLSKVHLS